MLEKNTPHEGYNVKRIREILGVSQDQLAYELGDDWNQQKIHLLENKREISAPILEQVAKALKVKPEAIKHFDANAAVNIISNTFHDESTAYAYHYKCTFNPIDKVVEILEEQVRQRDKKIAALEKKLSKK